MFRNITAFMVIVTLCYAVPFGRFDLSEHQDIADFSHSNKEDNVFLPFRDTPERLIDTDDDEMPSISDDDIFYRFGTVEKLSGSRIGQSF